MRCSLGAVIVSVLDLMIESMGVGWTFVLLSGLCVAVAPLLLVIMFIGPKFRRDRREREAALTRVDTCPPIANSDFLMFFNGRTCSITVFQRLYMSFNE